MALFPTHPTLLKGIKILSCILIAGALGLLLGKGYAIIGHHPLPQLLEVLFWIGSCALFFHLLEGIAAAVLAYSRGKNPLKAGIYAFWTGFVGLYEIISKQISLKVRLDRGFTPFPDPKSARR